MVEIQFKEVEQARNMVARSVDRYSARIRARMNEVYRRAVVSEFFQGDDDVFVRAILEGERFDDHRGKFGSGANRIRSTNGNIIAVNFA